jgi:hypothetical protein
MVFVSLERTRCCCAHSEACLSAYASSCLLNSMRRQRTALAIERTERSPARFGVNLEFRLFVNQESLLGLASYLISFFALIRRGNRLLPPNQSNMGGRILTRPCASRIRKVQIRFIPRTPLPLPRHLARCRHRLAFPIRSLRGRSGLSLFLRLDGR